MSIRSMIRMILNESFESDKNELVELYPDFATQISQLGPKWIMWLSSRFGLLPKREEVHPFEDALTTILAFSKKDSAIGQKYKSSEQWRSAVDAQFPERKWATPADPMTMTVDDMETLLAMSERKKQNVDANVADVSGDFLAKVGPWNLWMPSTKENSCTIAGIDPLTLKPATTWCTARTSGSNLFYNYVARDEDIILFYLIKDDAQKTNDRLSVGFVGGKPKFQGDGGVSVNGNNAGLSESFLKKILGSFYEPIMNLLHEKSKNTKGQHPAKNKIIEASQNANAFYAIMRGLSGDEANDMKEMIAKKDNISEEVAMILAKDENQQIRIELANNAKLPSKILEFLALDELIEIRRFVAQNTNTHAKILDFLLNDEDRYVRVFVARNSNTNLNTLLLMSKSTDINILENVAMNPNATLEIFQNLLKWSYEGIKYAAASNEGLPNELFQIFAADENKNVRFYIAENKSTPYEILMQLAKDKDSDVRKGLLRNRNVKEEMLIFLSKDVNTEIRQAVASNMKTPIETLKFLAYDKSPKVRQNVARSNKTPIEVLKILAKDKHEKVNSDAFRSLQYRQPK